MASRTSAARASTSAATPTVKPPCRIHPTAVIADKAQLSGSHPVEIGEDSILHPYARIRTEYGPVTIGKNVTVHETAVVGLLAPNTEPDGEDTNVVIEDGVDVGTGAEVQAKFVGEHTIIEGKVKVGKGAVIGKFCKIAPMNVIKPGEILPDYTVVYGDNQRRIDQAAKLHAEIRDSRITGHAMEIQLLKKLISNSADKWR